LSARIRTLEDELQQLQSQTAEVAEDDNGCRGHANPAHSALDIDIRGKNNQLNYEHNVRNNAIVVSKPIQFEFVCIGSSIRIFRDGKELLYHIGGYGESDMDLGIIAYNVPLLAPLFGEKVGFTTVARIGKTDAELKILEIQPCDIVIFFKSLWIVSIKERFFRC
jgi:transcription elongation GreA/GreB family factor